jgi:hypothetical protein
MMSSGILRSVALVRTDVSEERSASCEEILRLLLVTANVVLSSPIFVTLMEALSSSETSVPTRNTRRNITEDTILNSHRRKNLKSYTAFFIVTAVKTSNLTFSLISPEQFSSGEPAISRTRMNECRWNLLIRKSRKYTRELTH